MDRKYRVTVNGNAYEVTVEEIGGGDAPASAPKTEIPASAFAEKEKKTEKPAGGAAAAPGAKKLEAPMPGSVVKINVAVGASFKKGDVLVVLEAMKMENEIVAPESGTVASVAVSVGSTVETGSVLLTFC